MIESPNKNLIEKSVLLGIRLDSIGKKRKISENVLEAIDANSGMIHVHKDILNCPELNALSQLDSQIRAFVRWNTYPTDFGTGVYILPLAMLEEVDKRLILYQEERNQLIAKFCIMYEQRKSEAGVRLGRFYNEADYPPLDTLTERFSFKVQCLSFDVPECIASVKQEIFDREKGKAEESWSKTFALIRDILHKELVELISLLIERLEPDKDGKKKKFKDATINNLIDFVNIFEKRNITDDRKLEGVVEKLKNVLNISITDIRENFELREELLYNLIKTKSELLDENQTVTFRTISF